MRSIPAGVEMHHAGDAGQTAHAEDHEGPAEPDHRLRRELADRQQRETVMQDPQAGRGLLRARSRTKSRPRNPPAISEGNAPRKATRKPDLQNGRRPAPSSGNLEHIERHTATSPPSHQPAQAQPPPFRNPCRRQRHRPADHGRFPGQCPENRRPLHHRADHPQLLSRFFACRHALLCHAKPMGVKEEPYRDGRLIEEIRTCDHDLRMASLVA